MSSPPDPSAPLDPQSNRQFYGSVSYAAGGAPQPPKKKIVTPIRVAIVVLLLVPTLLIGFLRGWFRRGRDVRTTALVEVAPLRLAPDVQPLAGAPGVDADGYPTQYVDLTILRAMLARKRYADLTTYFERFQDDFEADPKKEYWIHDAEGGFASSEMSLEAQLDGWVAASPSSFAPYLARGSHRVGVGAAQGATPKATPGDIATMKKTLAAANDDLTRALSIRPKLVPAKRAQISMARMLGNRQDADRIYDEAISICPTCFLIRIQKIENLAPRFGGSFPAMTAFAAAAPVAQNGRLRFLPGYIRLEESIILRGRDNLVGARAAADAACAVGSIGDFYRQREVVRADQKDLAGAKEDIEKAISLRPMNAKFYSDRAYLAIEAKDYEGAAKDLLVALRIDPTDGRAHDNYALAVDDLAWMASEAQKRGDEKEALRLIDLDAELSPAAPVVQFTRMKMLTGSKDAIAKSVAAAQAVLAGGPVPTDIDDVRRMDYALSDSKRFEDILTIWNRYIAEHPDDGRAYLERAGTHKALKQIPEAGSDARKACDLGFDEGCLHAQKLGM